MIPGRFEGVRVTGVDEHVLRHAALLFRMEVRDLRALLSWQRARLAAAAYARGTPDAGGSSRLKARTLLPVPVRRVMIAKASGKLSSTRISLGARTGSA